MTYEILDHGQWDRYEPSPRPINAPEAAIFSQRRADGRDWYDFARHPLAFQSDSLKIILLPTERGLLAQAVVRDPSLIFPQGGQQLVEVVGHDPTDPAPHKAFEQRVYQDGRFVEPEPPPITHVSAAQAKTALFNAGLDEQVEAVVRDHPYKPVRIFYDSAGYWEISNPYVRAIALELGLVVGDDDTALLRLFEVAAKI